jgi:ABC-type microcin C transport system permease subunit YejE
VFVTVYRLAYACSILWARLYICLSVNLCVHAIVSFFSFAVRMCVDILVYICARVSMIYAVLSVSEYVSTNRVCVNMLHC